MLAELGDAPGVVEVVVTARMLVVGMEFPWVAAIQGTLPQQLQTGLRWLVALVLGSVGTKDGEAGVEGVEEVVEELVVVVEAVEAAAVVVAAGEVVQGE